MVQKIKVEGFEACIAEVDKVKGSGAPIFVLFSGSKDASGVSWCSDCVTAEPVLESGLTKAPEDAIFIYVGVGPRDFWKDQKCVFRTDRRTRLKTVPTLIKWGGPERLEESQCANQDMVDMIFEDA
uniref:Thioredoxin domain-containing protein 17 n=1 Tax=Euphausia superba TaxID=6819 RepID=A0A2R2YWV6_EUPSU|nr:thioredoxin 3 [Euphausia superba]